LAQKKNAKGNGAEIIVEILNSVTITMASLFEQIAQRIIPASIIRENDEFMAFLDIFPNCKGQTLVIPKIRYDSDISLMPADLYSRYMLAVQHVISLLKK
jgi:histidine triad (HIT) family protein